MKKRIKRSITLLEIMIVVFLIGIIGTVLGFNMKGSLDKGKAFKSEEGAKQVRDILLMEVQDEEKLKKIVTNRDQIIQVLKDSHLVADPKKLIVDGWGKDYNYTFNEDGELEVTSDKLKAYEAKHSKK